MATKSTATPVKAKRTRKPKVVKLQPKAKQRPPEAAEFSRNYSYHFAARLAAKQAG